MDHFRAIVARAAGRCKRAVGAGNTERFSTYGNQARTSQTAKREIRDAGDLRAELEAMDKVVKGAGLDEVDQTVSRMRIPWIAPRS